MSVQQRALLIGLAGPAVQAAGIVWELAHLAYFHLHEPLSVRHIIFEPGFLLIFVGFLVSLVCIPVALEVATATPEDVELPLLGEQAGLEAAVKAVLEGGD